VYSTVLLVFFARSLGALRRRRLDDDRYYLLAGSFSVLTLLASTVSFAQGDRFAVVLAPLAMVGLLKWWSDAE
jgi:hypothetical protein